MSNTIESNDTQAEADTLAFAILQNIDKNIAQEFEDHAFPSVQAKEDAQAKLDSLPKNFFENLITSSQPKTNFPSIIHNYEKFTIKTQDRKSILTYERIKQMVLTHRLIGHTRSPHALTIDPQSILFFTGSEDTLIKCWHIPSLTLVCTMKGHEDAINGMIISPDKRLLASYAGKEDNCVRLWSLIDGAAVAVLLFNQGDFVTDIAFSPCNRFLAISTSTGLIRYFHITSLIPMLFNAEKNLPSDGRFPPNHTIGDLLFSDGDFSFYNELNPLKFIRNPPRNIKKMQTVLKQVQINSINFSPGGNFSIAALENGNVVITSLSIGRHWTVTAHELSADGAIFLKNSFHTVITWSQRSGEIKTWSFNNNALTQLRVFTVRSSTSRRSHLVDFSVSCDETLLYGCTSQSVFVWRIDESNCKQLPHYDDDLFSNCVGIEAHPTIPTVFMAITKNHIAICDAASNSPEPINKLIIPVETPRIFMAKWAPDGLSVIATDAGNNTGGGVFIFRAAEKVECRNLPQFFPSDFTESEWKLEVGQIEKDGTPTHLQSKSTLVNSDKTPITEKYRPNQLTDTNLLVRPIFPTELKYAWLNEELWVRRLDKMSSSASRDSFNSDIQPSPKPKGRPRKQPILIPDIGVESENESSGSENIYSDNGNELQDENDNQLSDSDQ